MGSDEKVIADNIGDEKRSSASMSPESKDINNIPALIIPKVTDDEHPLEYPYTFWFSKKGNDVEKVSFVDNNITPERAFEQLLKPIGSFASIEKFWSFFTHMSKAHELPLQSDYHLFKHGVRPMWEDENNRNGGKWIVSIRPSVSSSLCWENIIFAMIGEQFMIGDDICGVVFARRPKMDRISVWHRQMDKLKVKRIHDVLSRTLQSVNNSSSLHYEHKDHENSLQVGRSYGSSNPKASGSGFRPNSGGFNKPPDRSSYLPYSRGHPHSTREKRF